MSLRSRLKQFFRGGREQIESTTTEVGGSMALVEYTNGSTHLLPKEEAEKIS